MAPSILSRHLFVYMKPTALRFHTRAFTLVEMLIVLAIIALLASLTMGGYTYAMRSSKRRITTGTFEAVKSSLEIYNADFGEYPEPANTGTSVEIIPGKIYNIGGAACLYQALSGDGYDQIKLTGTTSAGASGASDGKTESTEIANMKLKEMPQTMWTKKGSNFFLVDGFSRPFQYAKAAAATSAAGTGSTPKATTINSTYDLWSYSEDETNITKKSIDTLENKTLSAKWIKNW